MDSEQPNGSDGLTLVGLEGQSQVDFSTPEAERALAWATDMVLEVRADYLRSASRRVQLYERTLGLAVIPILMRRAAISLAARSLKRQRRNS